MIKKIVSIILILCVLGICTVSSFAASVGELQDQRDEAEEQMDEVTAEKNSVLDEISELNVQINKYEAEIEKLNNKIDSLEESIKENEEANHFLSTNDSKLFSLGESQVTAKRILSPDVNLLQCVPFYLHHSSFIKLTHKNLS